MKPKPYVRKLLRTLKQEGQVTIYWVGLNKIYKRVLKYRSKQETEFYHREDGYHFTLVNRQSLIYWLSTPHAYTNYWLAYREYLYLQGKAKEDAPE